MLLVVATSATLLFTHLFRTETMDNPALGKLEFVFRWGRAYELRADTNRDGAVDFRALHNAPNTSFSGYAKEYWEDRNFDGFLETHVFLNGPDIEFIEIDDDADGLYDRKLTGALAAEFYASKQSLHKRNEGAVSVEQK